MFFDLFLLFGALTLLVELHAMKQGFVLFRVDKTSFSFTYLCTIKHRLIQAHVCKC